MKRNFELLKLLLLQLESGEECERVTVQVLKKD